MKKVFILLVLFAVTFSFAQNNSSGYHSVSKRVEEKTSKPNTDNTHHVVGTELSSVLTYLGEDFESATFPPAGWTLDYTGDLYWLRATGVSGYGAGSAAAKFNFYNATAGTQQSLVTPTVGATASGDSLKFDHAYATYTGGEDDQLEVFYSTDGGTTWTSLVLLHGGDAGELVTAPGQSGSFTPTAEQWATKAYALPTGTNKVKFTTTSAYGNNLYMDNIKVGTAPANDVGTYSVDVASSVTPGSVSPKATVKNFGSATQTFNVMMTVAPGGYTSTKTVTALAPGASEQVTFDDWTAALGSYTVHVQTMSSGDANPTNDTLSKGVTVANTIILTQSNSQELVAGSVSCNAGGLHADNSYFRAYTLADYGITENFSVEYVQIGVEQATGATGSQPVTVNLYTSSTAFPSGYPGSLTLIGTASVNVPDQTLAIYNVPLVATVPAGSQLVVEIFTPDGQTAGNSFFIGSNAAGESAPGYMLAATCGITTPSTTSSIGFPDMNIIINVAGSTGITPVELTSFTATSQNKNVVLNWATATETNNKGFEIQKQVNGAFTTVSFVNGKGTTTEKQNYSYTDQNVEAGKYVYRLKQIDFDGTYDYSSSVEVEVTAPSVYSLSQNYPNPFNPATVINFSLAVDSKVTLKIYNVLGQEVTTLLSGNVTAGAKTVNFNASSLPSGVYMYKIEAAGIDGTNFSSVKKMMLTK